MKRRNALIALAAVATVIAIPMAQADKHEKEGSGSKEGGMHAFDKAICVLSPTEGNDTYGTVTFTRTDDGILIEAKVMGLEPNQKHGFHVHEFGDISAPDGTATGGHFNPEGHDHAGPDAKMRHVGDLGNLEADANGVATYSRVDKHVKLDHSSKHCVVGRGIIVHAGTDDLTSQPTGAAGPRIAQGVIGIAKADE